MIAAPHPNPTLSVLIVGYQTRQMVIDCLRGVFAHTAGIDYEILVLDNSDDGTAQQVRREFPGVRVPENDRNLGFAAGNNELARHARGDYLLLLNPDTLIEDNALGQLVSFARAYPDASGWGGLCLVPPQRTPDPACAQQRPALWRSLMGLCFLSRNWMKTPRPVGRSRTGLWSVPILHGAFLMTRRSTWNRLGGFDESFFMYNEEVDLCLRLTADGAPLLRNDDIRILHIGGGGQRKTERRIVQMVTGRMHLWRKHRSPLATTAWGLTIWAYHAQRWLGGHLLRPVLGAERAARLRQAHAAVVCQPSRWWRGWTSAPPASRNPRPHSHSQPASPRTATTPFLFRRH